MRIERYGDVQKLEPIVEHFLIENLSGISMDDLESHEKKRADYSCLDGRIAIEIKTLQENGEARIGTLIDRLKKRHKNWPEFLRPTQLSSHLKKLDLSQRDIDEVFSFMGRSIKNHLKKANEQLAEHVSRHKETQLRAVFLINEDQEIYDPQNVAYITQKLLNETRSDNSIRLSSIDAVFFLTRRHATVHAGRIAFPFLCIESQSVENSSEKNDLIEIIIDRWFAKTKSYRIEKPDDNLKFTAIDIIPNRIKRYEKWELDYKRNRYMQSWSKESLQNTYNQLVAVGALNFVKGSPEKPSGEMTLWSMETMTHLSLELGYRSISNKELLRDNILISEAAKSLGFSDIAIDWLKDL
ncbi:hypothetical protein [Roseivivax sp. THAF30]|uniref:hypothetical protein n=1 Tax=Roseivivax sp. THAF30 TaxID=2587852 RepID=UPI001268F3BA|nr:hypothetical protein [Roseivivax sp. THAF30]QFT63751.1 hypothetical protein FIU91_12500 [Roseivivax sp. THAF30]